MDNQNGKNSLIAGIEEDARNEAEKIKDQADKYILERKQTIERQIEQIIKDAESKANEQIEFIKKNAESSIAVEKKRLSLRIMDSIVNSTLDKAREKIAELITSSGYPEILEAWIVEAGLGLNAGEAYVNASMRELPFITDTLLKKAAHTLHSLTGKEVLFKKSTDSPLLGQGIVLTAKDGRTAFNNQVHTRMLRYQSEIRKMIHDILFSESTLP